MRHCNFDSLIVLVTTMVVGDGIRSLFRIFWFTRSTVTSSLLGLVTSAAATDVWNDHDRSHLFDTLTPQETDG